MLGIEQIRADLEQVKQDIKTLYDMHVQEIDEVKKSISLIPNKDLEIADLRRQISSLNMEMLNLVSMLRSPVESKPTIAPIPPKKEVITGYCMACQDSKNLVNVDPEVYKHKEGNYRMGFCPDCGRKILSLEQ